MSTYHRANTANSSSDGVIREGRQLILDDLRSTPLSMGNTVAIDYAFPEKFVDSLSRQEVFNKHLFRPNTYLHKWWARRCGTTFRTILKHFAPDAERRSYYAPGGLDGKIVLDPMMGGGTTLHEAIRLGANVIGADIDPIPVIQARASLSPAELTDLRAAFDQFFADLRRSLGNYFETECPTCATTTSIQYSLYGIRKRCLCRDVVQVEQYILRQDDHRTIRINPHNRDISDGPSDPFDSNVRRSLIAKSDKQCEICGQKYGELLDVPFYARYEPVAVVAFCEAHGTFYRTPSQLDLERIRQADALRKGLDFGLPEDFAVSNGPKSGDLLRHNIKSYLDVFSSRQLLYMHHAIQQIRDYTGIERLNLGLLVSTSLEFNSMLCGYKGWYKRRPGAIRHTFALHAYSFQYTALENNPVSPRKSSGNLLQLFYDRIERGRKWAALPIERRFPESGRREMVKIHGETDGGTEVSHQADLTEGRSRFQLIQGDSQSMPLENDSVDIVVTDPPYYDSVQYGNLAEFFRVWLSRLLPDAAKWTYNETGSAVAVKATESNSNFMTVLGGIFNECQRVLKPEAGRMVFTFHHWDPGAWTELTVALKDAGFKLMNVYVVYSEHPISVHIRNLNAITHDCILVLAPDGSDTIPTWMPVANIDTDDSEKFCRQCGSALGWMLGAELTQAEIRSTWQSLIRGHSNG